MGNYWHDPVHFTWARIQAQPDLGLSIVRPGLALRRPGRIEDQRKVIYSQLAHSSESLARCTTLISITGCAVEFLLLFNFFSGNFKIFISLQRIPPTTNILHKSDLSAIGYLLNPFSSSTFNWFHYISRYCCEFFY